MKKDFLEWHEKKAEIDEKTNRLFFHEREIWFCHLGLNIGYEQDGKGRNFGRPIIVFRKFNHQILWGIPLTTKNKTGKFYFPINLNDSINRCAIISQLRLIDAKRLYYKIGIIDINTHNKLKNTMSKICSKF